MKLWELHFVTRRGEHEQNYTKLIEAGDYAGAESVAHNYCSDFWGEGEKLDGDSYEFDDGCCILTMKFIREVDKEEWKDEQFAKALIIE